MIETRTTDNSGTVQPESVLLSSHGMENWAIPQFRVEVARWRVAGGATPLDAPPQFE